MNADLHRNSFHMLDVSKLTPMWSRDTPPGSVFIPVFDQDGDDLTPMLVGQVNDTPVLINLQRGGDFTWSIVPIGGARRKRGYAIDGFHLEVDLRNAAFRRAEADMKMGEAVRFPGGWGLLGRDRHSAHFVEIDGKFPETGRDVPLVAFPRWELVIGTGADRHVLFHYTGKQLLHGPLDGQIDEEVI